MINIVNECEYKIDENLIIDYTNYLSNQLDQDLLYSIVFVDTDQITSINNEFRDLDKPTDVLSFEAFEDDYLGDIIICEEVLKSNAQEYGHSETRELLFLITHGFLHLNGYDHIEKNEELIMFDLQKKLLNEYGVVR